VSRDRTHDVVVYGATGFVGRLTAAYLAEHAPENTRIALGGRSRDKLEQVRSRLGGRAVDWPLVVVDSGDRAGLDRMAETATVIATTVGPYARYGLPLVGACADAGTHYADLTGEALFMREVIERFEPAAIASGARIVHACGFDSIPSDLGVLVLHEAVRRDGAGELEQTDYVVTALRGGISGGTIDSMRAQLENMQSAEKRAIVNDPYSLSPARDKEPDKVNDGWPRETDLRTVTRDPVLHRWIAPFVMAATNTRVVRRSNALLDWDYGRRFRYREVMGFEDSPIGFAKAAGMTGGLAAFAGAMSWSQSRALLDRVLPSPGEGPSEKTRNNGLFRIEIHGQTSTGAHYVADVAAHGDPGYAATAVMLGESALALALDGDQLPSRAGILTPATGIGSPLVQRLRAAGFTLEASRRG
jgi:short subunit dehydrogenase-like uncharacterized protein